eukprot:6196758-Pleurochrysis_carterae.AAC.3
MSQHAPSNVVDERERQQRKPENNHGAQHAHVPSRYRRTQDTLACGRAQRHVVTATHKKATWSALAGSLDPSVAS